MTMSVRSQARERSFQFLYSLEYAASTPPRESEIESAFNEHVCHFLTPQDQLSFARELSVGTYKNRQALDDAVQALSTNWSVGRMSLVDLVILRLAIFELQQFPKTPPKVVMDEAIELAKKFGSLESPSFVNGILDAWVGKNCPKPEPDA